MRRKDREVLDEIRIDEVINAADCCRLGFFDGEEVYIVPLNFGYENTNGKRIFYFHGAKEGRKIELIDYTNKNGRSVTFEMDVDYSLIEAKLACGHSSRFKSIIGTGKIDLVNDVEEKRIGLISIMEKNTGKKDWEIKDQMLNAVSVFKIEVEKLSCKENS